MGLKKLDLASDEKEILFNPLSANHTKWSDTLK